MESENQSEVEWIQQLQLVERRLDRIASWLSVELGFETNAEGNVNRRMNEAMENSSEALSLLRGEKDQIGLVGKVELLFRSWHILLSLVAALAGYLVRLVTES